MTCSDDLRAAVVDAWIAWDHHPGDERRAGRMEAVCVDVARRIGITTTEFRRRIAAAKRARADWNRAVVAAETSTR